MPNCIYYKNGNCNNRACTHWSNKEGCRKGGQIKAYHEGSIPPIEQIGIYKQNNSWVLDPKA